MNSQEDAVGSKKCRLRNGRISAPLVLLRVPSKEAEDKSCILCKLGPFSTIGVVFSVSVFRFVLFSILGGPSDRKNM